MNKTVNINLAGIFFHIDEDAYLKLQRYLEAIKRSFTDSQGQSEIISDIEHRIAELFNERVQNEKQVIRIKEVDEVITIMGQPEDYLVDDEIFEDEPKTSYQRSSNSRSSKKFFRDTDNSYVGGVSSGLGHYFGIDAIWIRIIWIILIFGAGTGIFLYILLWIFVPEAKTTSEKITMTGEPVNISNIEKKIKDGFDSVSQTVSDTVKNVDLPKQGQKIKSSSTTFFETIGDIFMFFLKMFAKFFGAILMFVGAVTLISLIVSLLGLSFLDTIHIPGTNFYDVADSANVPIWLMSIIVFFFIGIIAFFVFYLGLKILITNLKSIGNPAKYTLLGLWFISFVSLIVLFARFGLSFKEEGSFIQTEKIASITANDTLQIRMNNNDLYTNHSYYRSYGFDTAYDENDDKVLFSRGVRLIVRSTKDSIAKLRIERSARGFDYEDAKTRAERISYDYELKNGELLLDSYLTIPLNESRKGQKVTVTVFIPEGAVLYADSNTYNFHSNQHYYNDILDHDMEEHYLKIISNDVICLDCPEDEDFKVKVDLENEETGLKIDNDGIEVKTEDSSLKIDEDGIKAKSDNVNLNIDDDGIEITSDDN